MLRTITAVSVASILLAACGAAEPAAPTDPRTALLSAIGAVDDVQHVRVSGAVLVVDASISAGDGSLYLPETLQVVKGVAGRLHEAPPQAASGIRSVVFRVRGPAVDRLGRTSQDVFADLAFPVEDLRQADMDNLTEGGQLDLATGLQVENGAGREVLDTFCDTPELAAESKVFCPSVVAEDMPGLGPEAAAALIADPERGPTS